MELKNSGLLDSSENADRLAAEFFDGDRNVWVTHKVSAVEFDEAVFYFASRQVTYRYRSNEWQTDHAFTIDGRETRELLDLKDCDRETIAGPTAILTAHSETVGRLRESGQADQAEKEDSDERNT